MDINRQSFPVVSWKELQGNKYIKAIDPLMLLNDGLPFVMKARAIGSSKYNSEFLTVVFDKEYVEKWIAAKLIRPLSNYGIDYVTNLLETSWDNSKYSSECLVGNNQFRNQRNNDQQVQS